MRRLDTGQDLNAMLGVTSIIGPWFLQISGADERPAATRGGLRALARSAGARTSAGLVGALTGVGVAFPILLVGFAVSVVASFVVAAGVLAVVAVPLIVRRPRPDNADAAGDRRSGTFLDHLPLVTMVGRAGDSRLLYVSAPVERLLGVSPEQALAEDDVWGDRLHPLDRDRVLRAWASWLSEPHLEPFRSNYRMVGEGGHDVWVDEVTILAPNDGDRPPTFQRHLVDVSRQRQLEEQLRQAQRLDLLGRLAAGVAHDFNNLLAVIAGYAERLASHPPPHAHDESTVAIAAAAERGASLVRQLLAFSRPQPTQSRVVDLNRLLRDFAPMLGRVIGEDLELELVLDRRRLPVEVHPVQIDQVLMNIVVNARDAMPNGGSLTIRTASAASADPVLRELGLERAAVLRIADTGCGMDAPTQSRIFEPFFSTKGPQKGSGLGLATAYGIVRDAGGTITVASASGRGTTFAIYLPFSAAAVGTVEESRREPPPEGGPETVLLVEDEPALCELERLMLEEAGYDVLTAGNASEALVVVAEHPIDALVVDVVMPGMSGPQLVQELALRGHDVPTVFVSGYGADEISSRGLSTGRNAVVEKPFQADVLLRRVREVLDHAQARDSAQCRHVGWTGARNTPR